MAQIKVKGLDEYIAKLEMLTTRSTGICKMAVWEGGRVVKNAILPALDTIPVQDEYVRKGVTRTGVRQEEKDAIIAAFGLSKMRNVDGKISTKAGFKPGTVIRSLESGTSFMQKTPVVRKAVNSCRGAAQNAMRAKFEEEVKKTML